MKLNKDILTAKIQKVKKWTKQPSKKAKSAKQIRMSVLVANIGDVFYDEFSAQKQNVVDEIVYKSVEAGVYTAHVDTLCKNVIKVKTGKRGIGKTTVKATVKLLRTYASQEFYIGQVGNGNAGAYVFVDLRHPKATQIMANLFGLMAATTGVDNTNSELPSNQADDHKDDSLAYDKNDNGTNAENALASIVEEVSADNEQQQKSESLSFNSFSPSLKDLKPKQETPVNLYGKVSRLLKTAGKNTMVTQLMRLYEKAKNNILGLTENHLVYALNEAVTRNASDVVAYTASIIYNTNKKDNNNVSKSSKPVIKADTPQWFKDGIHKQKYDDSNTFNEQQQAQAKYNVLKKFFDEDAIKEQMGELYSLVS